jgi:hypothetical protein
VDQAGRSFVILAYVALGVGLHQNHKHVLIRYGSCDAEVQHRAEADRREVHPPIQVETATRSKLASSIGGSKNGRNGWVAYAVRTTVKGGSELLILVPMRLAP